MGANGHVSAPEATAREAEPRGHGGVAQAAATRPDAVRLTPEARRDFCVVVPAFNEAENVPELVAELRATFERFGLEGEVVLVDDGSSDGTAQLAERHAASWPAFRVVRHRTNFGKTEALLTAAEHTRRRWLILFDADLQHAPDEIPRYLEKLGEGWDIVTGRKVGRYEKGAVSRVYNWLSRRLFEVPVSDLNSMKGFDRAVLDEVRLRHDWHRFFVVLAYARGFTVTELPIALFPRRHGEAKYSAKSRIVVGVLDLVSVAFFLRFSKKPLLLFGATGMALAGLGMVLGLVTVFLRLAHIETPFGYRPFLWLVMLLETLGFLLFGIGMVAELIAQQHAEIDALHRRLERE